MSIKDIDKLESVILYMCLKIHKQLNLKYEQSHRTATYYYTQLQVKL